VSYPEATDLLVVPFRTFSDRGDALALLESNR